MKILIIINVLVYIFVSVWNNYSIETPLELYLIKSNLFDFRETVHYLGKYYYLLGIQEGRQVLGPFGPEDFRAWKIITHFFMHGSWWHLAINMFVLHNLGRAVINDWGQKRFVVYYIICGTFGGALVAFLDPTNAPIVGASGAISAVAFAFAMLNPEAPMIIFPFPFPIKAKKLMAIFITLSVVFIVFDFAQGISHFGHMAGLLIGFIFLMITKWHKVIIIRW